MHQEVAEHTEAKQTETGKSGGRAARKEAAMTLEAETGAAKTGDDEAAAANTEEAEAEGAETGDVEAAAADTGEAEAAAADLGEANTAAAKTGHVEGTAAESGQAETETAETLDVETAAADNGEAEAGAAKTGDVEARTAEIGQAETGAAETGEAEVEAAKTGQVETGEGELREEETRAAGAAAAETTELEVRDMGKGVMKTEAAEIEEPEVEEAGLGEDSNREAETREAENVEIGEAEDGEEETGKAEIGDSEARIAESRETENREADAASVETREAKAGEPMMRHTDTGEEESGAAESGGEGIERLNINETNDGLMTDVGEANGEVRTEKRREPRVVEGSHQGGIEADGEVNRQEEVITDDQNTEVIENNNEIQSGIQSREADNGRVQTEEVITEATENENGREDDVWQKAHGGAAVTDNDEKTMVNDSEEKTVEIKGLEINNKAAERGEASDVNTKEASNVKTKTVVETGKRLKKVSDAGRSMEVENTEPKMETGGRTKSETADATAKTKVGETSTNIKNEENIHINLETVETVAAHDRGQTLANESTEEMVTAIVSDNISAEEASRTGIESTTLETGNVVLDRNEEEETEKKMAIANRTEPIVGGIEYTSVLNGIISSDMLVTSGSDSSRNDEQPRASADSTSEEKSTLQNAVNETKEIEQTVIAKGPEGSTSMTKGAPNIAIQTSTRLTLDVDGLGSVTSDISKLESYESFSDDGENQSEAGSEHSMDDGNQNNTSVEANSLGDDAKALMEALALLDSEETDESSLQNTARTYGHEEDVMAGSRRRDDPNEGIADQRVNTDSALPFSSADGARESDSLSSIFSDVRSEVSEYTQITESDQEYYRTDKIRLTSDGESVTTFDDDEILESETLTRLGMLSGKISAKKLVWSLIAMASGIVEQVKGSETKITTSKTASSQLEQEHSGSQVIFEETANHDVKCIDDFVEDREEMEITKNANYDTTNIDDSGKAQEEKKGANISIVQLKEMHRSEVRDIVKAAKAQIQQSMTGDTQNNK